MNTATPKVKWGLLGSSGKMGSQVIRVFSETPEFSSRLELVFEDSGRNESLVQEKLFESKPQVLLDFSRPEALLPLSLTLKKIKSKVLICSTGWSPEQKSTLSKNLGLKNLQWLPNTSPGMAMIVCALEHCMTKVPSPNSSTISILEAHHIHKKDTPSGTALWLRDVIKDSLKTSCPPIEIQSQREGEIVGLHRVMIQIPGEKIELTHETLDRKVFASGALNHLLEFAAG